MNQIIKRAKSLLKAGYPVLPVTSNKIPTLPNWRKYQKTAVPMEELETTFDGAKAVAVFCGGPWRIFCMDIDTKHDLTGRLFEDFKKAVPNSILKKMMCQQTQSGGYHLVCKIPASRLKGNEKFASRYTTAYEKDFTYQEAFKKPDLRDKALKIALNDKSKILLESRSGSADKAGGYFLIEPSPGYKVLGGKIGELTEAEYDQFIEIARSFNEVISEDKILKNDQVRVQWETTPFDHFNTEGDGLEILLDNGWTIVSNRGKDVKLKRPGSTHTKDSAVYDSDSKNFFCYSTSTEFDTNKAYQPSSVFSMLECEGDATLAYKKLIAKGWGIPLKKK